MEVNILYLFNFCLHSFPFFLSLSFISLFLSLFSLSCSFSIFSLSYFFTGVEAEVRGDKGQGIKGGSSLLDQSKDSLLSDHQNQLLDIQSGEQSVVGVLQLVLPKWQCLHHIESQLVERGSWATGSGFRLVSHLMAHQIHVLPPNRDCMWQGTIQSFIIQPMTTYTASCHNYLSLSLNKI